MNGNEGNGESDSDESSSSEDSSTSSSTSEDEMEKKEKATVSKECIRKQARPLGRPSAAAAGFSTVGMSDGEVDTKVGEMRRGRPKAAAKPTPRRTCTRKDKAKVASHGRKGGATMKKALKGEERDSSSCSLSPAIAASEAEDDEEDESCDDEKGKKEVTRKKAGSWEIRIREEFPKSNIRRWTSPGPKFDIPPNLPSKEAVLRAKKMRKQLKIQKWMCSNAPADVKVQCSEEADAKKAKGSEGSKKEKGKDPVKPDAKKAKESGRAKKGKNKDEGKEKVPQEPVKPPKHRHRTKSARPSSVN